MQLLNTDKATYLQEDAISTLWHEINHNKNSLTRTILSTSERYFMECANEYVSRKTLPEFMQKIGKQLQNEKLTSNRESTGYNQMVKNIDYLFSKVNLSDECLKMMKKLAHETVYKDIKTEMIKGGATLLKTVSKKITLAEAKQIVSVCVKEGYGYGNTDDFVDRYLETKLTH